jgi:competence protein ComEA
MARRPRPDHQETVSRRLALLSAELAGDDWWADHTRVAEATPDPPVPPEAAPSPAPAVPVPGRHAARRVGWRPGDVVPAPLRGRVTLGPAQLAVVATLVAVGLAVTCWWVVRGDPEAVAPLAAGPLTAGPLVDVPGSAAPIRTGSSAPAPGSSGTGAADRVTVDVAGKVRRPGIQVLDAGSRVVDALRAAGGARHGVDLSSLNLARVLVDGEQVVVGLPAPVGAAASAVPAPGASGGPLVDLNTADQAALEALPEVGPVTAQAILAWRDEHGGFTSVDELLEVDGIGDATLGQIAPYVTV